jgi:hypothetical protein
MPTLDLDMAVWLATIELCSKDEAKTTSHINKRKKKTVWTPLPRTVKRSSPRPVNRIEDNRIAKTTASRTTTGAITSNNGDRIQATTPIKTK